MGGLGSGRRGMARKKPRIEATWRSRRANFDTRGIYGARGVGHGCVGRGGSDGCDTYLQLSPLRARKTPIIGGKRHMRHASAALTRHS